MYHLPVRRICSHEVSVAKQLVGYLLSPLTAVGLLKGLNLTGLPTQYRDFKLTAAGIMIAPRASDAAVTTRAGLLGTKIKFNVIAWGHFELKVWAALVEPVDPGYQIYSGKPSLYSSSQPPSSIRSGERGGEVNLTEVCARQNPPSRLLSWVSAVMENHTTRRKLQIGKRTPMESIRSLPSSPRRRS